MHPWYLVYLSEYDDPAQLIGPFDTREAALTAHFDAAKESGIEFEESDTPESYYFDSDNVRLARKPGWS